MQVLDLLNSGSQILRDNKIISHKIDSEIILAKILNKYDSPAVTVATEEFSPKYCSV